MRGGEGQGFLQRCHGVEAWQGGGKSQCMWGIGSGHILQSQPLKLDFKKKKEKKKNLVSLKLILLNFVSV